MREMYVKTMRASVFATTMCMSLLGIFPALAEERGAYASDATLSESEWRILNAANNRAFNQQAAVVQTYEMTFGRITSADLAYAHTKQKIVYVTQRILCWGSPSLAAAEFANARDAWQLLPQMPSGSQPLIYSFINYIDALGQDVELLDKLMSQRQCV